MFVTKFDGVPQGEQTVLRSLSRIPKGHREDAWSRSEPPEIGPDNSSP